MSLERIAPAEAHRRMTEENHSYLDVRSVPEFEGGHPEGAYNVPLMHMGPGGMEPNQDFLAIVESHFDRDTPLVVGCRSGGRSQRAAKVLADAGFTRVADQQAGFAGATDGSGRLVEPGWEPCNLPVATKPEPGRSYKELADKAGKA